MPAAPEPTEIDPEQRPRIERAWERIEARIASLPSPLCEAGEDFLARRRPGGSHRDYFSTVLAAPICYLPLWLHDRLVADGSWRPEAGEAWLEHVLRGCMWGYFYIRIQDDHLDEREVVRDDLLFGNVCIAEMMKCFSAAMPGRPDFERRLWAAWEDFTCQTLAEQHQLRSNAAYSKEDFEQHATKVAFARVPLLAVCLAADRRDLVPIVTRLIDTLGVTFGLKNDARGFTRDFANGQRTYLLARAGWERPAAPEADEPSEAVLTRLFEGGLFAELEAEIDAHFGQVIEDAVALGIGPAVRAWLVRVRSEHETWVAARTNLALARALRPR